jgi:hypothetical protein
VTFSASTSLLIASNLSPKLGHSAFTGHPRTDGVVHGAAVGQVGVGQVGVAHSAHSAHGLHVAVVVATVAAALGGSALGQGVTGGHVGGSGEVGQPHPAPTFFRVRGEG